ncbi:hypothetical protein B0H34DRAFT_726322 [Crassisporium funariophilum]|nr:hypothetical protein B0H34DRAFT_726322 [Crassisporium funariophilum]
MSARNPRSIVSQFPHASSPQSLIEIRQIKLYGTSRTTHRARGYNPAFCYLWWPFALFPLVYKVLYTMIYIQPNYLPESKKLSLAHSTQYPSDNLLSFLILLIDSVFSLLETLEIP